jgi:hypothetical protein
MFVYVVVYKCYGEMILMLEAEDFSAFLSFSNPCFKAASGEQAGT